MKTVFVFMSAILAGSLAASAQAPAPAQGPPTKSRDTATMEKLQENLDRVVARMAIPPCPVSMQAKQRGMTEMVKTGKNEAPAQPDYMPKPAQHIHLILKGFAKDKRVVSAELTVRGRSARPRIDNTQSVLSDDPSDLRRTLDIDFTDEGDGSASADLDLPAFTSVTSLQLHWMVYADGSAWRLADRGVCMVTPDPVMLIAGR